MRKFRTRLWISRESFITDYFNEYLARANLVFVNSENDGWLNPSSNISRDQPDGFVNHRGMFTKRHEMERVGTAPKGLFDCIILLKGKLLINDGGFGQVARYLKALRVKSIVSAILFDCFLFQ